MCAVSHHSVGRLRLFFSVSDHGTTGASWFALLLARRGRLHDIFGCDGSSTDRVLQQCAWDSLTLYPWYAAPPSSRPAACNKLTMRRVCDVTAPYRRAERSTVRSPSLHVSPDMAQIIDNVAQLHLVAQLQDPYNAIYSSPTLSRKHVPSRSADHG